MPSSIQVFVDLGGSDGIPHVFVGITDNGGGLQYYGYAPVHTSPFGPGRVSTGLTPPAGRQANDIAGHMDQVCWGSPNYPVLDSNFSAMQSVIATWTSNPGDYVFMGHNCGNFVAAVLKGSGINYPMAGFTNHPVCFIPWADKYKFFTDRYGNPAPGGNANGLALHPDQYQGTPAYNYVNKIGGAVSSPSDVLSVNITHDDVNATTTQTVVFSDGTQVSHDYTAAATQSG